MYQAKYTTKNGNVVEVKSKKPLADYISAIQGDVMDGTEVEITHNEDDDVKDRLDILEKVADANSDLLIEMAIQSAMKELGI